MNRKTAALAALATAFSTGAAAQSTPSTEQKIEALSREVEALRKEVGARDSGAGGVQLGGYGELHYNNLDSGNEIDFHRFVLFFGHQFSERIRFNAELEVEHALTGDDKPGEVELEQAYIDFDIAPNHTVRGGLFLIPVGILNETHEPPTFYGVERNPVESNIIPSTWWEGGAAVYGTPMPGWRYDFAVTSGLKVDPTAFSIRGARQKVAEATANDAAYTGRVKWTGIPGVELATTVHYQQDVTQGALPESVNGLLTEAHAIYARGPFALRALYAQWSLDGDAAEALGRDEQKGWYVEPSFKITPSIGVFARYNEWDTEAGGDGDTKRKQTDFGVNYWPHEQVVVKFDVQNQSGAVDDDGFNLGLGYMF